MQYSKFFTLADRAESIYQYVPFDVPINTKGITLSMRHNGKFSVIDLGLFDPKGFRGWSGSERDYVVIASDKATPGYLPGEIIAGTWFISLGLHRVDESGITIEVNVELGKPVFPQEPPQVPRPSRPPRRVLEASIGHRWFPADFHSHSTHSDGKLNLDELAALAASRGLEVLAITDHNTVSHHSHLSNVSQRIGINLLAGQEVTTDTGHANAFGAIDWVDYRQATEKWLSDTQSRGGILSINHPLAAPCHWIRDYPQGISLSEIWHSSWDKRSKDPIEWWEEHGRPIPIGGSDFHRLGSDGAPGDPTTWILCDTEDDDLTQDQVLNALSSGRVAISANPTAPVVFPIDDEIAVQDGEGCTLTTPSGRKFSIGKSFESFANESGLYTLQDSRGDYQALGYVAS